MIIDLTVKNFRSLKDEQLFSMNVENPKANLLANIARTDNDKVNILKTAGIYGANASGKSNLLLAFKALQWIVDNSGDLKEGESIPCYEPYLLSDETSRAPISLEVEFLNSDNLRYIYAISYLRNEILSESLDFYPSRAKANLFRRDEGDTWETISFGSHYRGRNKRIPFFKNNSYLSKAGNNAAGAKLIRSVYSYFRNIFHSGLGHQPNYNLFYEDAFLLTHASTLLSNIDTGITGITKKERKVDALLENMSAGLPDDVKEELMKRYKFDYLFAHAKEGGGSVKFQLSQESDGTQKLFQFFPILVAAFAGGAVLVMDELDNSFHPHVGELIIKLFNDPAVNKLNAQLIFTTHDINLMSPNLMRRDQVWFTEKRDGASRLYSLDEFDKTTVKSNSPYSHWYDEGRFGALPNINYHEIAELLTIEQVFSTEESAVSEGYDAEITE